MPKTIDDLVECCFKNTLPPVPVIADYFGMENLMKNGQPREYVKFGPTALLELYWKAINAYLAGEKPLVCAHEWLRAVAGYIPKKLSALLMTEFRQIACICT